MSAIPQLSGAKRTCLLGKISSNLRPLTLERSLARKRRVPFFIAPAHGPITAFRCRKVDGLRGKPDIKRHVGSAGPVAFDPYETSPAEFSVTQKEVDSVVGWDPRSGRPMRRRRVRRHSFNPNGTIRAAIQEPGLFAFYYPNLDVLNGGAPTPAARLSRDWPALRGACAAIGGGVTYCGDEVVTLRWASVLSERELSVCCTRCGCFHCRCRKRSLPSH